MNYWEYHPIAQLMEDYEEFEHQVLRLDAQISDYGYEATPHRIDEDFYVDVNYWGKDGATVALGVMTDREFFAWIDREEWLNE